MVTGHRYAGIDAQEESGTWQSLGARHVPYRIWLSVSIATNGLATVCKTYQRLPLAEAAIRVATLHSFGITAGARLIIDYRANSRFLGLT